jgi:hypothetical protein
MPKLHSWRGADSWIGAEKSGEMGLRDGATTAKLPGLKRIRICTQQTGSRPDSAEYWQNQTLGKNVGALLI